MNGRDEQIGADICIIGTCVYRELYPGILMMQTTEQWLGEDRPKRFYRPEDRTVLGQRAVRSSLFVVGIVGSKKPAQVRCTHNDDMVEAFASVIGPHRVVRVEC